jgi:hypothetical protein
VEERCAYRVSVGRLRARGQFETQGVVGRKIKKRIFNEWNGEWIGLIWIKAGTVARLLQFLQVTPEFLKNWGNF